MQSYNFSQVKIHSDFAIGIGHALKLTLQLPNESGEYDLKMTGSKEITAVCIPTYDEHLVKGLDDILDIIDKIKEVPLTVINDYDVPWYGLAKPKFPKVPKKKKKRRENSDDDSEADEDDEDEDEESEEPDEDDQDDDRSSDRSDDQSKSRSDKSSDSGSDDDDSDGSKRKKKKDKKDQKAQQKLSYLTA